MRLTFVNLWVLIYGLGIVWFAQPLVVIPAVLAALSAHGIRAWSLSLSSYGYVGTAHQLHRVIVGITLVAALVGLATTATTTATSFESAEVHLRDTPLATFFLITAACAWRALARATPRRTTALAFFIYVAWLPFLLWNTVQAIGDVPDQPDDWRFLGARIALGVLLASGAFVCWVATLASARGECPARARMVR